MRDFLKKYLENNGSARFDAPSHSGNRFNNVYFQFFDSGGTIETASPATAQSLSLPRGSDQNGVRTYYNYGCGDAYYKSIDFTYANMFPGTIRV